MYVLFVRLISQLIVCGTWQMQYTFQQVFDEFTTQKAIFDTVSMSLVDDVLRGKNGKTSSCGCVSATVKEGTVLLLMSIWLYGLLVVW